MKKLTTAFFTYILCILLLISSVSKSSAVYIETEIKIAGNVIAFDLYHRGYHANDIQNLVANLTAAGNTILYINETWELPDDVDALFLTQTIDPFTTNQVTDIVNWMALGDKLLWASGDSDYGGFYDPTPINNVLNATNAIVRLDATSIADPVFNDGASYRVVAPLFGVNDSLYDGEIVANLTKDMANGIMIHGPCSIIAFDGYNYLSLRYPDSIFPDRVWTIMRYSENATAVDSDVSDTDLDLYAESAEIGLYPAVVYEYLSVVKSHIIVSGEAIYSDYKYMYDQRTENGYNDNHLFGQVLVNNILNNFLESREVPTPTPTPTPTQTGTTVDIGLNTAILSLLSLGTLVILRIRKR